MLISPLFRYIAAIALSLGLIGCSDGNRHASHAPSAHHGLTNTLPEQGLCAGWQQSLAKGKKQRDVADCLRHLAQTDYAIAVEQANILSGWTIKKQPYSDLPEIVATLSQFSTPQAFIAYLASLDVLPANWQQLTMPKGALTASDYLSALSSVVWFDTETGFFPNEHDGLLAMLAEGTDLNDVTFKEQAPEYSSSDTEPYQLFASVDGRQYQQQAENYGDWYDVPAVLDLLNRVANEENRRSRFVRFESIDQGSIVWVVDKSALAALYQKKLIRLSPHTLGKDIGQSAEKEAAKRLSNKQGAAH